MGLLRERNPTGGSDFYRDFVKAEFRETKESERVFELSFSSEEPYNRYWGTEILDHSAGTVKLERLLAAGCLLFNHNRDRVIGKILSAEIKDGRGIARVEFDSDAESELIRQKVKSGTLRGVSVGYMVGSWEEVLPGKVSGDGRFTGPCDIARSWEPFEISVVSCPADYTVGVGRDLLAGMPPYKKTAGTDKRSLEWFQMQLEHNNNFI